MRYQLLSLNSGQPKMINYTVQPGFHCVNPQMWDALLRLKFSLEEISSDWELSLKKDLKKRISQVGDCLVIIVQYDRHCSLLNF